MIFLLFKLGVCLKTKEQTKKRIIIVAVTGFLRQIGSWRSGGARWEHSSLGVTHGTLPLP